MNVDAIEHHLNENDYTYNLSEDGFDILDPHLTSDTLLEVGACDGTVLHRAIGFRIVDKEYAETLTSGET
ncbi:hypothetical protein M199_gp103 [Halogranum tailed virus 1]|uniref:Uncharacterized protein n=1 Tax=Halogranum tailed virus 1 TaxID=1273749 RepID=R4TMY7_9CAUD|nr:hypothetical protein M199_gp103 [Halogranum tailed virus 1]AGM11563.1 hypothetical protein HGTV1_266 [Halogranum tailed virus 1]